MTQKTREELHSSFKKDMDILNDIENEDLEGEELYRIYGSYDKFEFCMLAIDLFRQVKNYMMIEEIRKQIQEIRRLKNEKA